MSNKTHQIIGVATTGDLPIIGTASHVMYHVTAGNGSYWIWRNSVWEEVFVSAIANIGNILYVAPNGSDTDTTRAYHLGRLDRPFQTLNAASTAAVSGDVIHVFPGDYTPTANLAKDGVKYYFEADTNVTMTAVADMFDITGFTTSFDVLGYGSFYKTTGAGYIFKGASGVGGYEMVFEARKVSSTISHCFYCPASMTMSFKVDYAKSTAGKVLGLAPGSVINIEANTWVSTAANVIGETTSIITGATVTVKANHMESTSSEGIYGFGANCFLNLNINTLLGATWGLSTQGSYDYSHVILNCSYVNSVKCWSTIRFNGHCGQVTTEWNGIGKHAFIGGSCSHIVCGAGYIETTLGGSSTTEASVSVSGGTVMIKEAIGNLNGVQISSTGGELHFYSLKKDSSGRNRNIAGGTVYLYDAEMSSIVSGSNDCVPIIKLQSGTLYLRGRIALTNTNGNPYDAGGNPIPLTQTNRSNAVMWTGGNLVLDGCTIITQDQNDLAICSRAANQVLRVTSKGAVTNRPELGGLIAGKKQKILMTVDNVSFATVNHDLNTGAYAVNFSTPTSGKTTTQVATDLCTAINAHAIPITATDNGNGSYYLEADVAGAPFTYTLYNQPYTGQISLTARIYRDNSYPMTNPLSGLITESSYII